MEKLDKYPENHHSSDNDIEFDQNERALYDAIQEGSLKETKRIVKKSFKLNQKYIFGDDMLFSAIWMGHEDIAMFLIKNGANLNAIADYGDSAFMSAISHGLENLSSFMIKKNADIHYMDDWGRTAFHRAISNVMPSIAKKILDKLGNPDLDDHVGRTLLYFVVFHKDMDMADLLLEMGADVNRSDIYGVSPLMVSIHIGLSKLINDIHVKKLKEREPSVDHLSHFLPNFASGRQNINLVKKLLKNGAYINAKDCFGNTPLMIASISGYQEAVELLIENKAEVNEKDNMGSTALKKAISKEHLGVAKRLLLAGANPNVQNFQKESAIHDAVLRENIDLINLLLDYHADLNLREEKGQSPLHLAVKQNWIEGTKLLIENGTDIQATDNNGHTAHDYATANGYKAMELYLNSIGVRTRKNTHEHYYLRINLKDDIWGKDIAYAFYVIPGVNNEITYIVLAAGFSSLKQTKPEIRKFIISFHCKKVSELYAGKEKFWFDHWKRGKGFYSGKLKYAVQNRDEIRVPKRMPMKNFDISPPKYYSSEYENLSNLLNSYINHKRNLKSLKSSSKPKGRFTLTEKANKEIGNRTRIISSYTSIEHVKKISDIGEAYFIEGYYN